MTIKIKKTGHNILNKISMYAAAIICLFMFAYLVEKEAGSRKSEVYNFVDLQMKYKRYIVIDKFKRNDNYVLILQNPETKKESEVLVADYVYMNVYFVSDIIN